VVGIEGDFIDGGVFGSESHLSGGEGGVEESERGCLGEVMEDDRIRQWYAEHGLQRFLGAAAFLGAG
jgi:hypothetical protein